MKRTFKKYERLCDVKIIKELFNHGKIIKSPLFVYHYSETQENNKILIKIPKKKIKKATDRNTIKRRIRETWRLNKPILANQNKKMNAILVYSNNAVVALKKIKEDIDNFIACAYTKLNNEQ